MNKLFFGFLAFCLFILPVSAVIIDLDFSILDWTPLVLNNDFSQHGISADLNEKFYVNYDQQKVQSDYVSIDSALFDGQYRLKVNSISESGCDWKCEIDSAEYDLNSGFDELFFLVEQGQKIAVFSMAKNNLACKINFDLNYAVNE